MVVVVVVAVVVVLVLVLVPGVLMVVLVLILVPVLAAGAALSGAMAASVKCICARYSQCWWHGFSWRSMNGASTARSRRIPLLLP